MSAGLTDQLQPVASPPCRGLSFVFSLATRALGLNLGPCLSLVSFIVR